MAKIKRIWYFAFMQVRSCRVTIRDIDGIAHTVEVTASTVYEAVLAFTVPPSARIISQLENVDIGATIRESAVGQAGLHTARIGDKLCQTSQRFQPSAISSRIRHVGDKSIL